MKSIDEKRKLCGYGLYDFLKKEAANPSKRFLFTETRSYTFQQVADISESLAERLYAFGMRKGHMVAVRATRSVDTLLIFFALGIIGAVAVMTDAHFGVREFIRDTGVDISPDYYITNENAAMDICGTGNWVLKAGNFGTVCPLTFDVPRDHTDSAAKRMSSEVSVTDPAIVIFTSGSTGTSKAVLLCQRNVIANSVDGGDLFEEGPADTNVLILPLHHIFGIALAVCALVSGHDVFVPANSEPGFILRAVAKYRLTIIYGVPTYILSMCEMCGDGFPTDNSLRFVLLAGGPSTQRQAEYIERTLGTRVIPVYGMSEYVGISTCAYSEPGSRRCSGVGTFYPMNEGFILDDEGNEVPPGSEGEICVRGWDLMLGYYGNEEETRNAIDGRGRLHTGDLGYTDKYGILHITGRKKDIIIRGGENLSAGKIEKALLSVDCVSQAAVVAGKDERFGEVPLAAVILKKGASAAADDIAKALSGRITPIEMPEHIAIVTEFPLTSTGKINKPELSRMLAVVSARQQS